MQAIQQFGIEFIVPLQSMGTPLWGSFFSFITHLGAGGYLLCMVADRNKPLLSAAGSGLQKTGHYLVGIILLFLSLILVRQLQPETAGLLQNTSIWLTGALLLMTIGYLAPRVFVALKFSPGR